MDGAKVWDTPIEFRYDIKPSSKISKFRLERLRPVVYNGKMRATVKCYVSNTKHELPILIFKFWHVIICNIRFEQLLYKRQL